MHNPDIENEGLKYLYIRLVHWIFSLPCTLKCMPRQQIHEQTKSKEDKNLVEENIQPSLL